MSGTQEKRDEQHPIMHEGPGSKGIDKQSMTQGTQETQGTQGTQGTQSQQKTQEMSHYRNLFQQHKIIPDIVDQEPQHLLEIQFNGVSKSPGDEIRIDDLKNKPKLKWVFDNNKYYALMMLECCRNGKQDHQQKKYWCVLNIQGNNIDEGFEDIKYQVPTLSKDNDESRLVFLVFEQQDKEQVDENEKRQPGINVNVKEIIQKQKLQTLTACNFFTLRR